MPAPDVHYGHAAKLYYNTGTYASPTWVEIPIVQDASFAIETTKNDASTRGFQGWKADEPGLKALSGEANVVYNPGGASYDYLRARAIDLAPVEFAFLDGDEAVAGSEGPRFTAKVFAFNREEPIDGILTTKLEVAACQADNPPEWLTTTGP